MQNSCCANLQERDKIFSISAITGMPALQIQYVGALAYGNYKVVTTVLTLYADDTDGATTAVLTADTNAAGYDTFGELVDAINATGVFRAFLIGANRSDDSDAMLDAIANVTCKTTNGKTLYFEQTTTSQIYGMAITNQKFTYRPIGGWDTHDKGWTKDINCINSLKMLDATFTLIDGGAINIYAADDEGKNNGVLVWSDAFATTVQELHGNTVPDDVFVATSRGMRLVIQFPAVTTVASDFTAAAVRIIGHTKDVADGLVPDSNYTGSV